MNVVEMAKKLFGLSSKSRNVELRSIVLMQRAAYRFSKEELRAAGERGWGKRFDGQADPMYFVSAEHQALTIVKAGPHIIRITCLPRRFSDDDEYALSQLPEPEQKRAWMEHHACVFLELFNDLSTEPARVTDADAYASLAQLALQLGDPNCVSIFLPVKNMMMPNDGTAEEGLRLLINKELPL